MLCAVLVLLTMHACISHVGPLVIMCNASVSSRVSSLCQITFPLELLKVMFSLLTMQ